MKTARTAKNPQKHILRVLRACEEIGTDDNEAIGRRLYLSPETVATYFKRANAAFGTKSRFEAVWFARIVGLIE